MITCSVTGFSWDPAIDLPITIPVGQEGLALLVQLGRIGDSQTRYWMVMIAVADRVPEIALERDVITSDFIHLSAEDAIANALSWRTDFEQDRFDARDTRAALDCSSSRGSESQVIARGAAIRT